MEDLKIGIHLPSCQKNKFSDKDFINLLKDRLEKFDPKFFIKLNHITANYQFGYTTLSAINLKESEQKEIIKIIKITFNDLIKIHS